VGVTAYSAERDEDAVHQMVYVEAGWGDVPGHHVRSLESWRNIVAPPARGWVARHEGRPVGWVSSRLFADGRGWVSQLAVAEDHRRAGLGRALLLHAFGDLLEAGATALALGVAAENASALGLYRSVGLEIWRESRTYLLEVAGA
jgi:ribosomal protein S18 acetylase RimI-like enzyme